MCVATNFVISDFAIPISFKAVFKLPAIDPNNSPAPESTRVTSSPDLIKKALNDVFIDDCPALSKRLLISVVLVAVKVSVSKVVFPSFNTNISISPTCVFVA